MLPVTKLYNFGPVLILYVFVYVLLFKSKMDHMYFVINEDILPYYI
jgi:hypothetical protein